jgi:transcriptional regulator with XRE-family HTH domain
VIVSITAVGDDPNVRRRQLRVALRQQREAANLTQNAVAKALDWSLSKLIRIETGNQRVSVTDLRAMLALYGVADKETVEDLASIARASRGPSWWHAYRDIISPQFAQYLGHEGAASSFCSFHPLVVPGLLQIKEYIIALVSGLVDDERAHRIAEFRLERQERLLANSGFAFKFIVNEEALYRWVGGPHVMLRQLQYLAEAAEQENISIGIVPFQAGAHPGLAAPFVLLDGAGMNGGMAFIEAIDGDRLLQEDPKGVARYKAYFRELSSLSLSPDRTDDLLRELAGRFRRAAETEV